MSLHYVLTRQVPPRVQRMSGPARPPHLRPSPSHRRDGGVGGPRYSCAGRSAVSSATSLQPRCGTPRGPAATLETTRRRRQPNCRRNRCLKCWSGWQSCRRWPYCRSRRGNSWQAAVPATAGPIPGRNSFFQIEY